ncbi:MAG: urease accessory protein UreF [Alphaproteobacteria bacterium]
MIEPAGALVALQHGDSFFPSGNVAFSGGIETLRNDGLIGDVDDVAAFICEQLRYRWARFDRPALAASHRMADDLDRVVEVDVSVEAMSLVCDSREGSRRAGAALLIVHEKLGTPWSESYYRLVRAGRAPGHQAVVQGLVWRGVGLDEPTASAVSAYAACVGLLSAALRLGLVGHVGCQRVLSDLRGEIVELVAAPAPPLEEMGTGTPETDVAAMRHEVQSARLFVT